MRDFDNFLDSLDLETSSSNEETQTTTEIEEPTLQEPQAQSLSDDDFNDILSDMGFEETSDDGEEEEPQEEMEYFEVNPENRNLAAEEDADWEEAISAGVITPIGRGLSDNIEPVHRIPHLTAEQVENRIREWGNQMHFHMPDGTVIDVPIEQEEPASASETDNTTGEEFLIQPNSPTLTLDESTSRFSGTEWYEEIKKQRIILAGCGGIGSNVAFQLARMTPDSIFLYDDDVVEMANMSGQLYSNEDVGMAKVDAIARTIGNYTTAQNIYALNQRFTADTEAGDIMICGFDNMKARKIFFEAWHNHITSKPIEERSKCLFIDGRLSISCLQVFCIRGDDAYNAARYRNDYLFSDEEADATVCSMKQTTYLACMIGSFIVNLFTNHVANILNPIIPYDLPFFTEYDAQNMIFKTEN